MILDQSTKSTIRPKRPGRSYHPNGKRECARRRRQNARLNQVTSHLPGTVWPAHLGPRPTIMYSQVGP